MRPLVVFINNGWYFRGISGGDVHILEVAKSWAADREVTVAMPQWAYDLHSDRLNGVKHIATGGALDRSEPGSLAGLGVRYVARMLTSFGLQGEIVIAASHYPYDLLPAVIASRRNRAASVVYVFHLTSMFRNRGARARLVALWERVALRLMRNVNLVLVDNREVKARLIERHIPAANIGDTWNAPAAPAATPNEPRRNDEVVFCGRITDTKGWRDLVAIGDALRAHCPGVTLRVLGDGDRRSDLEKAVAAKKLDHVVRVEGFVSEAEKWRALSRATVFVSPSREEGWGIAISEALQAGAQVVAYDLPVYREVHAGGRLHVVATGDVEAITRSVVDLVQRPQQPGQAPPQQRTWPEIAAHEARLIRELVS